MASSYKTPSHFFLDILKEQDLFGQTDHKYSFYTRMGRWDSILISMRQLYPMNTILPAVVR